MEILDCKVVLPAFFTYKHDDVIDTIFCYIDHFNKSVVIPDCPDPIREELSKLAYDYIISKSHFIPIPKIPNEGFSKIDPKNFTNSL